MNTILGPEAVCYMYITEASVNRSIINPYFFAPARDSFVRFLTLGLIILIKRIFATQNAPPVSTTPGGILKNV